jgi:hypothetical protein
MISERHQCNGDEMAALPRHERRFLVGQQFGLADNIDLTPSSATFSRRAKMSAATWRWHDVRPSHDGQLRRRCQARGTRFAALD